MNRSFADYLVQMREHCRRALVCADGFEKNDFLADWRTQQAVLLSLLIVGESSAKILELYPDHAARYPGIPWRSMRGMRNRIAHDYFSIDVDIVWDTLSQALPKLLREIDAGPT